MTSVDWSATEWVLIITAIGAVGKLWIDAYRTRKDVAETKALTVIADKKLDVVMGQGDGMRTELLDRIAALERMLSTTSGNKIRAETAEQAASDHRAASKEAKS